MARRTTNSFLSRSLQRSLNAMTRKVVRAGATAIMKALRAAPRASKVAPKKRRPKSGPGGANEQTGIALGVTGARRYRLYQPPGMRAGERVPLLVMLHGCAQDGEGLAASSRMNAIAARAGFLVLYPEQDRVVNMQGCWNWYDTRSGRAQREADSIAAMIDQVCRQRAVDPQRIALVGLSAGASMAALLATRHPERFRALAMHSGVAPGLAQSPATALSAMRGRRRASKALAPPGAAKHWPSLLVIQGSADPIVAPGNGAQAAQMWAAVEQAQPGRPRSVQRGARYRATLTDYRARGRLVVTLCEVMGLGHAWSGGAAGRTYSDPKGPDASRMIWAFMAKQFAHTGVGDQHRPLAG